MMVDVLTTPSVRRLLLVVTAVVVAVLEALQWHPVAQPGLALTLAVWALVVLAAFVIPRLGPPLPWVLLLSVGAISLLFLGNSPVVSTAMFLAVINAGTRLPLRQGLPVASATIITFALIDEARSHIYPLTKALNGIEAIGIGILFYSALYAAGFAFQRLRMEQARTQDALEQLRLSRAAQLESAKVEERARLAREIHDVLAHTLSALVIQLESARLLLEQRPGDPAALPAVERAHRLAQDGLVEARRAVGTLRGATLPGPEALGALAADFQDDTGVPCRLEVEGVPAELSSEAGLAVYRTAQEALANVRKHARATAVRLRLHWQPDGAELTVEDEGEPKEMAWGVNGGYGLVGIRERAELLGGRLEAGPLEHGFRVRLWVPS